MEGKASHELVTTACTALNRMTHRGAVSADGKTGDGCGVLLAFPEPFFRCVAEDEGIRLDEQFAVGMVFLDQDEETAKRSRKLLARQIRKQTLDVAGWRKVPIDKSVCGETALQSLPTIEQVFINAPSGWARPSSSGRAWRTMFGGEPRETAAQIHSKPVPRPFPGSKRTSFPSRVQPWRRGRPKARQPRTTILEV